MKIAIVVPGFPPRWLAGTELTTYNIARHLAKREYEVHVIDTARIVWNGFIVHYNFFSPHVELKDSTPAKMAGIY